MSSDERGTLEQEELEVDPYGDGFDEALGKPDYDPETFDELKAGEEEDKKPAEKEEEPKKDVKDTKDDEETYEQRWKSLQGIHRSDKEKWAEERDQLLAKLEEVEKNVKPKEEATKEEKPVTLDNFRSSLTEEQKAELEEYERDFDTVAKMEGLKREMAMAALKAELKAFKDEVLSQLEPTTKTLQELTAEREVRSVEEHFGKIREAHGDYEKHVDALKGWIETRPKYLQRGLMEVYEHGTAEEIVELLTDFKAETGIDSKVDPEKAAQLNSKREQKRQALSTVPTKRSAVNASMSAAEDFEGAFDEAMRE